MLYTKIISTCYYVIFFFCGEKVQNKKLSGVYLTNSGTAQNQEKSGKSGVA